MKQLMILAMLLLGFTELKAYAGEAQPQFELSEYILTEQLTEQLGYERLTEEAADLRIMTFDVSEEQLIAAGYENGNICIYSRDGSFVTGFHIETNGGAYHLQWENELLCAYILRSDFAVRFHLEEGLVSAAKIPSSARNSPAWKALSSDEAVSVGDEEYRLASFFWEDTIVRILPDGTTETCVSVRDAAIRSVRNMALIVLVWLGLLIAALLTGWKRNNKSLEGLCKVKDGSTF